MKNRIAAILGVAVFLVLAGTGIGYALWSSNAQVTGTVTTATLSTNCTAPTQLVNGGFEQPNISPDALRMIPSPFIPGWSVVNDNVIEVWRSLLGTTPWEGAQVVELNGNNPGTLYQVVATTPGQTLNWSLKHRGRFGNDTMRVAINANGAALVQQDQFTTGTSAWSLHQGTYVVPAGQTQTRISLVPVSTTSEPGQNNANSVGNLVDDVTFGTGPCLTAGATIANITTGGTTYAVGDVVEYTTTVTNGGGAHAAASIFTASVPTGLVFVPGSITVGGVAKSDSAGNDEAEFAGTTITARLGQNASASAGGSIPPGNSIVVKFRATVQASAAGGNLVYTSTTAYVDSLAPTWALSAVSPNVTTAVAASADIAVAVQTLPQLGSTSGGQARSWVMRVTNNGPSAGAGVSVAVTVPDTMTNRTVTMTGGGTCTTVASNASTCTINAMASGSTRDITFTGTMPASPLNSYAVTATATSTSYDPVTSNNTATGTVQFDNQNPAQPLNLTATRATGTQINLAWQASNDNVAVAGYRIYRNGVLVTTTAGTGVTYSDTGLPGGSPYWYWVQAVDTAGNVSAVSAGDGAVTYAEATSYRVQYVAGTSMCLVAASNNDNVGVTIQSCTNAATAALRQWMFTTISGDDVYVRFATGIDRRWSVANDTSGTDLSMSTTASTSTYARWNLGAYWTGTAAVMEIRRSTVPGLCIDIDGASTAAGAAAQQYTCNQTVAQRFALTQP